MGAAAALTRCRSSGRHRGDPPAADRARSSTAHRPDCRHATARAVVPARKGSPTRRYPVWSDVLCPWRGMEMSREASSPGTSSGHGSPEQTVWSNGHDEPSRSTSTPWRRGRSLPRRVRSTSRRRDPSESRARAADHLADRREATGLTRGHRAGHRGARLPSAVRLKDECLREEANPARAHGSLFPRQPVPRCQSAARIWRGTIARQGRGPASATSDGADRRKRPVAVKEAVLPFHGSHPEGHGVDTCSAGSESTGEVMGIEASFGKPSPVADRVHGRSGSGKVSCGGQPDKRAWCPSSGSRPRVRVPPGTAEVLRRKRNSVPVVRKHRGATTSSESQGAG